MISNGHGISAAKIVQERALFDPVSTKSASDNILKRPWGGSNTCSFTSSQQSMTRANRENCEINFIVYQEGLLIAYDWRNAHEEIFGRSADQVTENLATIRDKQASTTTEQARPRHSRNTEPTVGVEHVLKLPITSRQ
jgi:hypothetical protein